MNCDSCNGTGDGTKSGDGNCSICNGTGSLCDICGESCVPGSDLCPECEVSQ